MDRRIGIGAAKADISQNLPILFCSEPDSVQAMFGRDLDQIILKFRLLTFGDIHCPINHRQQGRQKTSENDE